MKILQIELKDYERYPEIVSQVEEVVKDDGLNVLFNSAGISPRSSFFGMSKLKVSELMDVYAVNCVAPLMLTKVSLLKQPKLIKILNKVFNLLIHIQGPSPFTQNCSIQE